MRSVLLAMAGSCVALAACAADPGTRPRDMSADQHDAVARREEQSAALKAQGMKPNPSVETVRCAGAGTAEDCTVSVVNYSDSDSPDAKKLRKLASEHRAASAALRDAEIRACDGLSDFERRTPVFSRESVVGVRELMVEAGGSKDAVAYRLAGAVVTVRPAPALTAPWLNRVVDCHLATNATLGQEDPEWTVLPIGATARVTQTQTGFEIAIRSDDSGMARTILRRAKDLLPH